MLYQEEFVNMETGEVLGAAAAIHQFYTEEGHNGLEDWRSVWKATGNYTGDPVEAPNFTAAVLAI